MLRLKGIIYLALSLAIMWHEYGTPLTGNEWTPKIEAWASTDPVLEQVVNVFIGFSYIVVLVYFLKGLNFTFISGHVTKEEYNQTPFGLMRWNLGAIFRVGSYGSKSNTSENSVENMKRYRDSKFSNMSNDEMANDFRKTAWLDGLNSGSKARDYVNSKLSAMDNESGYKWLKGDK